MAKSRYRANSALDEPGHRKFLMERELAERWNKTKRTLQRLRKDGTGPAYHRIGGSILYKIDDVEAFEAASRVAGAE